MSPASGTGNVSESMLMSHAGRVREVVRADQRVSAVRAVELSVHVCFRGSCMNPLKTNRICVM